jgi:beta-glucosidase
VTLAPGDSQEVRLTLTEEALSFYDPARSAWVAEPGKFRVHVGSSSRAIRCSADLDYMG